MQGLSEPTSADLDVQLLAEQAAGAGWWSLEIATGRDCCSPGLYRLLGLSPGSRTPRLVTWLVALSPGDAEAAAALIRQSIDSRGPFRAVYRVARPAGHVRWIEALGRASYDGAGQPVRFSGYCIDITDRQKAEEEVRDIKERQAFLLKLSDALAPLFDPVQIQVEACRVLGQHLGVNRVFYADSDEAGLNRAGPQYVDGVRPTAEVWHTNDFDPSLLLRYQTGEVLTCDDVTLQATLSPSQRAAYEADRIVAWAAAPIAKRGMPLGRLVIHQNRPRHWTQFEKDLIKETAERVWPAVQRARIQSDKQAAEAANVAKSQFLSVMSHELRTPLTAIMGMFQLIDAAGASEKVRDYVSRGLRSSEHLLRLVEDILDFSSIEAGRLSLVRKPFRLGTLLEEVSDASAGKRKTDVEFAIAADAALLDLELLGDPLRLKQVLINLLGNAFKFTDHGRVTLSVQAVGGTSEKPLLDYKVEDTGIGLTPDQKGHLFQAFTQLDMSDTRRFGGTGLGLVISQRLVSLLGGEPIAVESRLGHGSRFAFRLALPLAPPRPMQSPAGRGAGGSQLSGLRVLVVEDSETVRLTLRLLLQSEGASVTEAADGAEGVSKALAASPPHDVVLMDMQLPVQDGLEATRELRRRGYAQPIIALTANAFARDMDACLAAGMNGHVTKPVKMPELIRALQAHRRAQQGAAPTA